MKDKNNFYVKNPHGTVVVVGESELVGIKRNIEAGLNFEILGPVAAQEGESGVGVELPENQDKNPLECLTCGHVAESPEALTEHLMEHLPESERSSISATSSPTTSPKRTSRKASKNSASKSSASTKKTVAKKR